MIVTEENIVAINEAKSFEKESIYSDIMCGNSITGGPRLNTVESSIKKLEEVGITEAEKKFYIEFYNENKNPVCCLPKGHKGHCKKTYSSFFSDKAGLKIKDCQTSPGDDDIIFKNRTTRNFPIQISNNVEFSLKKEYSLKSKGLKLKAAVPIKNASTPFLMATAEFDIASYIIQLEEPNNMDEYIKTKLNENFNRLVNYFKLINIYITDQNNNICCPVTGEEIKVEMFGENGENQIQFGHINPVSNDRYMTRGENLVLITRIGNLIQGDRRLSDVSLVINKCYNHLNR